MAVPVLTGWRTGDCSETARDRISSVISGKYDPLSDPCDGLAGAGVELHLR